MLRAFAIASALLSACNFAQIVFSECTTSNQCDAREVCTANACVPVDDTTMMTGTGCTDSDGDGVPAGAACTGTVDCAPNDPTASTTVSTFLDADLDGYPMPTASLVCTGSVTGPGMSATAGTDCDDNAASLYRLRPIASDVDADGHFSVTTVDTCVGADAPSGTQIGGGDDFCDNKPLANTFAKCPTCVDGDSDGHFAGCDAAGTGADACDADAVNWQASSCAACADGDGDGHFAGCDTYPSATSDSCDGDPNNHTASGCANCRDTDGDGFFVGCDVFNGARPGPDCNDADDFVNSAMPGDRFGEDSNCDGTTLTLSNAAGIFVAPPGQGGDDLNPGTQALPMATIAGGLAKALPAQVIFVMQGNYDAAVTLTRSIYGGFQSGNWSNYNSVTFAATVSGGAAQTAMSATNRSLVVSGLAIAPDTAGAGDCVGLALTGSAAHSVLLHRLTLNGNECASERMGLETTGLRVLGDTFTSRGRTAAEVGQTKSAYGVRTTGGSLYFKNATIIGSAAIVASGAYSYGVHVMGGANLRVSGGVVQGGFGVENRGIVQTASAGTVSVDGATIIGTTDNTGASVGASTVASTGIYRIDGGPITVVRSRVIATRACGASASHFAVGVYANDGGGIDGVDVINSIVDAGSCKSGRGVYATTFARARVINSHIVGSAIASGDTRLLDLSGLKVIVINSVVAFESVNAAATEAIYLRYEPTNAVAMANVFWSVAGSPTPSPFVTSTGTPYATVAAFNALPGDIESNLGVDPLAAPLRDAVTPPAIAGAPCRNAGVDPAIYPTAAPADRYTTPIRDFAQNTLRPVGAWDIGVDEIP
ncbi:MAG: hypothetical protein IT381_21460 [Deltaproteobacteria bacterium]|nr:hypothetical protein [Deltaproteobacteria bacterium]